MIETGKNPWTGINLRQEQYKEFLPGMDRQFERVGQIGSVNFQLTKVFFAEQLLSRVGNLCGDNLLRLIGAIHFFLSIALSFLEIMGRPRKTMDAI